MVIPATGKPDPARMAAIGYGEHRPVGDNASDEGRQRNRRVTLVILGTKANPVTLPPEDRQPGDDVAPPADAGITAAAHSPHDAR